MHLIEKGLSNVHSPFHSGNPQRSDSLEVFDQLNNHYTVNYDLHQDSISHQGSWELNSYGSGRIENIAFHMQETNPYGQTPHFICKIIDPLHHVTVYPGGMNDDIDVLSEAGVSNPPPVHIKPSSGVGSDPGDRISVDDRAQIIFDYEESVPLNLYSLDIGSQGTVTFDPATPAGFIMNVANLTMVDNQFSSNTSNFDLAEFGLRVTNFTGTKISSSNTTSYVTISGIGDFLRHGFVAGGTSQTLLWSSVASVSMGDAMREIHESSGKVLLIQVHDGDANRDGKVDITDLYIATIHYEAEPHSTPSPELSWTDGDFTGDGWVDGYDLAVISANWQYGV